jgi:hypothetical protein
MANIHLTHKEKLSIRKKILNLLNELSIEHNIEKKDIKIYYDYFNRKLDAFYTDKDLQEILYNREILIDPNFLNLYYMPIFISTLGERGLHFDAPIDFLSMRRKDILNKIID